MLQPECVLFLETGSLQVDRLSGLMFYIFSAAQRTQRIFLQMPKVTRLL